MRRPYTQSFEGPTSSRSLRALCGLRVKKALFPVSRFVSITSALFSATAHSQPLSHQSLAHSFPFNRGVSLCSYFLFPLFHFPVLSNLLFFSNFPYALPSYVYRKSFVCHSCENYRGGGVCFPFWNQASALIIHQLGARPAKPRAATLSRATDHRPRITAFFHLSRVTNHGFSTIPFEAAASISYNLKFVH